jgi:hypothetical protein
MDMAYLDPNKNNMQKPKRGRSLFEFFQAKNTFGIPKEGRSTLAISALNSMLKTINSTCEAVKFWLVGVVL